MLGRYETDKGFPSWNQLSERVSPPLLTYKWCQGLIDLQVTYFWLFGETELWLQAASCSKTEDGECNFMVDCSQRAYEADHGSPQGRGHDGQEQLGAQL